MLCVVLALSVGLQSDWKTTDARNLAPKTRPTLELAPFKGMKQITVTEYRARSASERLDVTSRVYRYTYRARYEDEVKRLQRLFPKQDGWLPDPSTPSSFLLSRLPKHPKVQEQAVVLNRGRIEFDLKSPAHTKHVKDPAWVYVSYNEVLNRKTW